MVIKERLIEGKEDKEVEMEEIKVYEVENPP